jgi:hypothetical protein
MNSVTLSTAAGACPSAAWNVLLIRTSRGTLVVGAVDGVCCANTLDATSRKIALIWIVRI